MSRRKRRKRKTRDEGGEEGGTTEEEPMRYGAWPASSMTTVAAGAVTRALRSCGDADTESVQNKKSAWVLGNGCLPLTVEYATDNLMA